MDCPLVPGPPKVTLLGTYDTHCELQPLHEALSQELKADLFPAAAGAESDKLLQTYSPHETRTAYLCWVTSRTCRFSYDQAGRHLLSHAFALIPQLFRSL